MGKISYVWINLEFNMLYYLDVNSLKLTKPVSTTNTWVMVRVHLPTSAETSSMYVSKAIYNVNISKEIIDYLL